MVFVDLSAPIGAKGMHLDGRLILQQDKLITRFVDYRLLDSVFDFQYGLDWHQFMRKYNDRPRNTQY